MEETGCFEEAADCLRKAFEIQEELFGPDHPETISTYNNLGLICTDIGDYEAAESFYRRALRVSEEPDATEDPRDRLAEARHYLMRALEITTDAYGSSYPDNACTLNNLGLLEDLEGNHKKAREHYRKALEIQNASQ